MKKMLLSLCLIGALHGDPVEELKTEVCDITHELGGWSSSEKVRSFIDLVLEVKPKLCVEIGVYTGGSFVPVALALKFLGQGMAVAIDPWDKVEAIRYFDLETQKTDFKYWASVQFDHLYLGFLNTIRQFELEEHCVVIRATSKKAASAIGTIDILHIDGNHYEKIVAEDVLLYLPKVRTGGYIWFNDAKWKSLQQAVQLLSESCEVVKTIDNGNCILFRKR